MLGYFLCALGFLINAILVGRVSLKLKELQKLIEDTDLCGLYPRRIGEMETKVQNTLVVAVQLERLMHETRAEVLKIQRMLKPSTDEEKS